jgi:hypothetical protein
MVDIADGEAGTVGGGIANVEGWGIKEPNSNARVVSSEASAKNETWLREGRHWINRLIKVDSDQQVRKILAGGNEGVLDVGSPGGTSASSESNMLRSMIRDL